LSNIIPMHIKALRTLFTLLILLISTGAFSAQQQPEHREEIRTVSHMGNNIISLPKPKYPAAASSVHASGTVKVSIVIDERGYVEKTKAISGHLLLRAAAVSAAKRARFNPVIIGGKSVKSYGVIHYNFLGVVRANMDLSNGEGMNAENGSDSHPSIAPAGISLDSLNTIAEIPPMPKIPKTVRVRGLNAIRVSVRLDMKKGEVLEANIVSGGHPLVDPVVLKAAKGAKCEPDLNKSMPGGDTGFITFILGNLNRHKNARSSPFLIFPKGGCEFRGKDDSQTGSGSSWKKICCWKGRSSSSG